MSLEANNGHLAKSGDFKLEAVDGGVLEINHILVVRSNISIETSYFRGEFEILSEERLKCCLHTVKKHCLQ